MSKVFIFDLPPTQLSPNARVHWATRARVAKKYKTACHFSICQQSNSDERVGWRKAKAIITFYRPRKGRPADPDNLMASMKYAIDSLVSSGVVADDRGIVSEFGGVMDDNECPRVQIELTQEIDVEASKV